MKRTILVNFFGSILALQIMAGVHGAPAPAGRVNAPI